MHTRFINAEVFEIYAAAVLQSVSELIDERIRLFDELCASTNFNDLFLSAYKEKLDVLSQKIRITVQDEMFDFGLKNYLKIKENLVVADSLFEFFQSNYEDKFLNQIDLDMDVQNKAFPII